MADDSTSLAKRAEMEQAPSQQVNPTTTSTPRPKPRVRPSASIAQSPQRASSSRGKKQTKAPSPEPEEELYSIKDIIREKTKNGRLLYLIDWDDDPDTGKPYDRTWEPADFVTPEAIADWEKKKKDSDEEKRRVRLDKRKEKKTERKRVKNTEKKRKREEERSSTPEVAREPSSLFALSEDSTLPSTNQHSGIQSRTSRDPGPAAKKRRPGTPETVQSRSVFPEIPVIQGKQAATREIKDSYEDELQSSAGNDYGARVEIGPVSDSFNRDEYLTVAASQASQAAQSTGPLSNSSPPSSQAQPSPQPQRTRKPPLRERVLFWEDDFEGEVPDSQELPGSSLYVPPETQASRSELGCKPSTQINTQVDLGRTPLSNSNHTSSGGGGIVLTSSESIAGSSSYHPSTNFLQESGHISTTEVSSIVAPSTEQSLEPTQEVSQESQLQISSSPKVSEDTRHSQYQEDEIPDAQPNHYETLSTFTVQTQVSLPASVIGFGPESVSNNSSFLNNPPFGGVIQSVEYAPEVGPSPRTPAPHNLPSESNMEDRPPTMPPSTSTKQLMREARARATAKRAAERAAEREAARSASTMPASPPPTISAQLLPLRETLTEHIASIAAVEPVSSPKPSPEADEESVSKALRILPLGPGEYIIPLPLVSYSRDIYMQTIRNYKKQRLAFLEEETGADLVSEIDVMLGELGKLCDHQDLIADDFSSQRAEPIENQARYAETVSTKCIFLAEFITALRHFEKHVVILSRPGRLQEILETLLIRHGFDKVPQQPNWFIDTSRGPLRISLLPFDNIEGPVWSNPADVIISFNEPTGPQGYLKTLRAAMAGPDQLIPFVSLVVMHSVEHLNRCVKNDTDGAEKRLFLVNCISQIQDDVGKLGSDNLAPPDAAHATASFLMNETEGTWPVPELPEINGLDFEISPSPAESGDGKASGSTTQSYDMSSSAQQYGAKRQLGLDVGTGSDTPKRQRLSPLPGEQIDRSEMSCISETARPLSSNEMHTEVVESWNMPSALDVVQQNQPAPLLNRINDLENQIRIKDATEGELRERNRNLEARCKDLESSIKEIQPRYQDALNDRGHFEHEITESLRRESALRRKHDDRVAELDKVREEKEVADTELASALEWLSSSAVPEIAEVNRMKEEVRIAKAENERLQKRHANMQNDLDFIRNQYQTASFEAAESSRRVEALEETISDLSIKASDNAVHIHKIHHSSEVQQHLDRVKELAADNEELDRELEKKTEELRVLMNGRRQTRGTSVPRSPRMGAGTMSPGARPAIGRVIGNFGGQSGSRGNSPAPGEVGARGSQFGEALFQGPSNSGRWGNHLQ
ncbi:uncharacterized protein BP5553_05794 [Venustampulla echinocandica]|uniref:Chromo domain-containing protein n=1 Tax=Venustampulla echinocandica TaxID=2656787 RepID=A0A370TLN1_9HELO|nr:uncharacterized protein BP5553_05794 [Venustampulla echinocandica]RDL36442.1 hypothetical protein BP5553_05794 [Venustampulla echinocandica]